MRRDDAETGAGPEPGAGRSSPPGGDAPPLCIAVVAEALGRAGAGGRLAAFLAEADPAAALRLWLGGRRAAGLKDGAALRCALDRDMAALDQLLCDQTDAILHHPAFQRLEASWRGLRYLLDAAEDDPRVRIRMLSATWAELCRDLDRAAEFDQSILFERIYSDEFGMPGGTPYGLIVCDYEARHAARPGAGVRVDDVASLSALASIGAAAFAPCVLAGGADLLSVESFAELSFAQDLQQPFRMTSHARWRDLQSRDDSRFLAVAVPRMLLRDAFHDDGSRRDGFRYREGQRGLAASDRLWGSAAYAVGGTVIRAFRNWGWFADIRGARQNAEEAGIVGGLPAPLFSTGEACAFRRPIDVELTDRKQKMLEEIGITVLSPCHLEPYGVVLGTPSLHMPLLGGNRARNANATISAMLQYVLCISRFAHYVKVMARDYVGAYTSAQVLEIRLNKWLMQYVVSNTDASDEIKAKYPLNSAAVSVTNAAGKSGAFNCVIQIKPHFQIDQMVATVRFQTELHGLRP